MDAGQEIENGIACLRSGRVNGAAVIFRNVLAADSDNIEALVLLGSTEQVIGNHNEAIKLLEKAMSAGGVAPVFRPCRPGIRPVRSWPVCCSGSVHG